ncbi:MAG: hypothetical protein HKO63_06120 [Acidimicrobiia bacterium]|nr:hypothetical protein [Acidimicrobiia bacterium]NNL97764.1 hypothetical protein [Acidimicrobiia bacterium]
MTGDPPDEGAVAARTLLAVAIVVSLAALIGIGLAGSGDTATSPEVTTNRVGPVSSDTSTTTTPSAITTTTIVPASAGADLRSSVRNQLGYALSAWGRFAGSGDLVELEGFFDPAGPQYQQLLTEADGLAQNGGMPYQITMPFPDIVTEADTAVVTGLVVFAREDTVDQTFNWSIEMRRSNADSTWGLWTVEDLGNFTG